MVEVVVVVHGVLAQVYAVVHMAGSFGFAVRVGRLSFARCVCVNPMLWGVGVHWRKR
jgi:hypothetical protein